MLIGKGLGWVNTTEAFRLILYICVPFILLKLITDSWSKNDILWAFLLNTIGMLNWLISKNTDIFLTTIVITSAKNIDIPNLFKYSFWVKFLMFVSRTSMAILGYVYNPALYRYVNGEVVAKRYALGYGHPNAAHYNLFVIIVLLIISYKDKLRWFHFLAMFIYNFFIFKYTTSKTGFLLTSLAIVLSFLITNRNSGLLRNTLMLVLKRFSNMTYIFAALLSLAVCMLISKFDFLSELGTLTGRFTTAVNVIQSKPLSLFGISNVVTDFGYINILYGNGILPFALFIIGNTVLLKKMEKNKLFVEKLIIVLYAVYTLAEAYSTSILMNVALIYCVTLIYPITSKNNIIHLTD